jgi:hypothetical protein
MVAVYGSTRFEFNELDDLKNYTVFLADVVHGTPPWRPLFFLDSWGRWAYRAIQRAAEQLSLPTTKGWDIRFIDGYPYPTVIETTPQEIKERAPVFRERIKPYIEDFDAVWDKYKTEIVQAYDNLKKTYGLEKYENIRKLSNIDLLDLFDDYMQVNRKQWDIHMGMMACIYSVFDQMSADFGFATLILASACWRGMIAWCLNSTKRSGV